MKTLLLIILLASTAFASAKPNLVARIRILSGGESVSKYAWYEAEILEINRKPADITIPRGIKLAIYNWVEQPAQKTETWIYAVQLGYKDEIEPGEWLLLKSAGTADDAANITEADKAKYLPSRIQP